MKENKQSETVKGIVGVLTIIIITWVGCKACSSKTGNQTGLWNIPDMDSSDMKLSAFVHSQTVIKDFLKAPSTADFPSDYETQTHLYSDSTIEILSYLDAQNSFGAKLRQGYFVKLKWLRRDENKNDYFKTIEAKLIE